MKARILALVAALALLTTGCGPTFGDLPLPGNGVSGDTVTVKVQFDEALNLAEGASVKVNGVASGKVISVGAKDFKAIAVLKVLRSAHLRTDATARLRYTTPLGELFVDVTNPSSGPLLRDGQLLDPSQATTAPTVEDALSSASLLVNGGGLNQLQTVTDQLNAAIGGREGEVRTMLSRADTFLHQANATTGDIDRALRALAGLSVVLRQNKSVIHAALTDIRPAAAVLRQNTPGLTRLLAQLAQFSGTANQVVGQTRSQILLMMREASPVLQEFLDNSSTLGPSLSDLINIGKLLNQAVPGDYANMRLALDLANVKFPNPLSPGGGGSTGSNGNGTGGAPGTGSNPLGDLLGGLLGGLIGGGKTSTPSSPLSLSGLLGGAK